MTHPDRLSDLKLQDLLLTQLIESSPTQFGKFMESFLQYLEIKRSQSKPDYWRIRILNLLREMQENDRWIACYYLSASDEKTPMSIWDPHDTSIIEITRKGKRDLQELQRLLLEEAQQKEEEFKAIISTKLSLLVRNYDYPNPEGQKWPRKKSTEKQ